MDRSRSHPAVMFYLSGWMLLAPALVRAQQTSTDFYDQGAAQLEKGKKWPPWP
jgi:hypothetical protein